MSKKTFTLIILIVLAIMGGCYYWFFIHVPSLSINTNSGSNGSSGNGIFAPFGNGSGQSGTTKTPSTVASSSAPTAINLPVLRELSSMPVGGMTASTTASTTIVRWVERGTGHVYQAYEDNTNIDEISNTTVPMIYESYWNSAANAFILQSLTENSDTVTNFYAKLSATASTSSSTTPYSLTGTPLSVKTLAIAVSPFTTKQGSQVFTLAGDGNGGATGYISNFDGTKKTQIFDTPLTELNVQWPATNTIALTTKGSGYGVGFLYFVNTKTGAFTRTIGNVQGLSTLTNSDGSEVLYSGTSADGTGIVTSVYNLQTAQNQVLPFSTLAEKCVWSALQKNILYCAIPSTIPAAEYPDAWYQGQVSFNDNIWEIDTVTGDVHELIGLIKTSGVAIDAENLELSPNENLLYFINKNDLSLWSFNLNAI